MEKENATQHLPRDTPIRVLADISTSSLESSDKFKEVRDLLDNVIPVIFGDSTTDLSVDVNLLDIEIRGQHTFAIFDAHHDEYEFLTAHEEKNNKLPVYRVSIKKRGIPWIGRAPNFDEMINGIVSELHRLNGYGKQPPYIRDYRLGPVTYGDPREAKTAVPKKTVNKENEVKNKEVKKKEREKQPPGPLTYSDPRGGKTAVPKTTVNKEKEVENKEARQKEANKKLRARSALFGR